MTVLDEPTTLPQPRVVAFRDQPLPRRRDVIITRVILSLIVLCLAAGLAVIAAAPGSQSPQHRAVVTTQIFKPKHLVRGITLSGLQDYVMSSTVMIMMKRQIRAAKIFWHANTIRLQITQDRLVGAGGRIFNRFYWYFIKQVMAYGLSLHMKMVPNAQTEQSPGWPDSEPLPDYATGVFWQHFIDLYKNNPLVAFDLFNEPRKVTWDQWLNGYGDYWGMQKMVDFVRATGARNQLWVEGRRWVSTLNGVPILNDPLHVKHGIWYTLHHPGSDSGGTIKAPTNAALIKTYGAPLRLGLPVLDSEFANYRGSYDWKDPTPNLLRYWKFLAYHHIGLMAWSLVPGSLNANPDYMSVAREPQSDGQLLLGYFQRQWRQEYPAKRRSAHRARSHHAASSR